MNNVKIWLSLFATISFLGTMSASEGSASEKHINELVNEWQELVEYCSAVPQERTSASCQKITTDINQRMSSLQAKTNSLTVNEVLQAYDAIETNPKTARKPGDLLLNRHLCHSCREVISIFNLDKADALILHELGADNKTCAEIRKDESLQKELQARRVRVSHTHVNKTLANPDEVKKKLDAILQKK